MGTKKDTWRVHTTRHPQRLREGGVFRGKRAASTLRREDPFRLVGQVLPGFTNEIDRRRKCCLISHLRLRGAVDEYDIYILEEGGSPSIIAAAVQISDRAAIKSARRMAHGRQFEVWRGSECITGVAHLLPPLTS